MQTFVFSLHSMQVITSALWHTDYLCKGRSIFSLWWVCLTSISANGSYAFMLWRVYTPINYNTLKKMWDVVESRDSLVLNFFFPEFLCCSLSLCECFDFDWHTVMKSCKYGHCAWLKWNCDISIVKVFSHVPLRYLLYLLAVSFFSCLPLADSWISVPLIYQFQG